MAKTLTRIAAVSSGLLIAAGAALATAPSASALTSGALHNSASGLCLGIYGNIDTNGQDAIQWGCNGNADQNWDFTGVGGGYYQLQNGNGKCLGVYARTSVAIQWDCNGNPDQKWSIDSSDGYSARLKNGYGQCLDITSPGSGNGAIAYALACDNSSEQRWHS
ncbi:RICIN domain-containing protein [Kitasatospora azatica]|uniref:RICIN domain-containing protein n=1 Tax=Kitasatospora azatica TaxID=58347 RepID=UPI000564C068|nr:RICIN domain-containing protein [Kitasatospora azatica]